MIALIIISVFICVAGFCYAYFKWRKARAMAQLYRALLRKKLIDQAYYWTDEWQNDEAEARAELAAGLGRTFDNVQGAISWLEIEGGGNYGEKV